MDCNQTSLFHDRVLVVSKGRKLEEDPNTPPLQRRCEKENHVSEKGI